VAGFWSEYYNMMEFQFLTTFFQVKNVGNTRIMGGEISVMGQGKIGKVSLDIVAGYNYLDPRYKNFNDTIDRQPIIATTSDSINILKYRSRHSAKLDVQANYKGFGAGVTFQYMSFMENIDNYLDNQNTFPSIRAFRDRADVQAGTFILNARLSYKYKFVKLSVLGNNLLNYEYWLRPGRLDCTAFGF
jgi:iron complex outermembrane receptor protein